MSPYGYTGFSSGNGKNGRTERMAQKERKIRKERPEGLTLERKERIRTTAPETEIAAHWNGMGRSKARRPTASSIVLI